MGIKLVHLWNWFLFGLCECVLSLVLKTIYLNHGFDYVIWSIGSPVKTNYNSLVERTFLTFWVALRASWDYCVNLISNQIWPFIQFIPTSWRDRTLTAWPCSLWLFWVLHFFYSYLQQAPGCNCHFISWGKRHVFKYFKGDTSFSIKSVPTVLYVHGDCKCSSKIMCLWRCL